MVKHCEHDEHEHDEDPVIEDLWSLKIKTLRGEDAAIDVNPSTSVLAVKERLCAIKEITLEQQRLIYRGRVLSDDSTMSDIHVKDGDTIHLVIRQVPPAEIDPTSTPQTQQSSNTDEPMNDSEFSSGEGVSNLLNQLFEDISNHSNSNAPSRFLIDQLRRNLNMWNRESSVTRAQTVNNNPANDNPANDNQTQAPPTVPYPETWNQNVTDLRQAFQACQEQVNINLPGLYSRANQLVSEDAPDDPTQFRTDMRQVAINFRRLGKIFSLLGRLCSSVDAQNGDIQVTSRRQSRRFNFNGMVVTQTHLNLNPARRNERRNESSRGGATRLNINRRRPNPPRAGAQRGRPHALQSMNGLMNFIRQHQAGRSRSNSNGSRTQGGRAPPNPSNPSRPPTIPSDNNPEHQQEFPLNPFSMFLTATRRVQVPAPPQSRNSDPSNNSNDPTPDTTGS